MTKKNAFVDHLIWFLRALGLAVISNFLMFGLLMAPILLEGWNSLSRIHPAFVVMIIVSIILCTVARFMSDLERRDERWKAWFERWRAECENAYPQCCCRCACCRCRNRH